MESILLAVMGTGATLFTVLFYNPGAQIANGVSTSQVQNMLYQIELFWIIALSTQIFLSTLVWKAVVDRSFLWFLLAVLYHAVVDAVAVFLSQIGWSYWAIEGVLSIFLVLNIFLIYRFWKDESELEKEMDELEEEEDSEEEDEEDGEETGIENEDEDAGEPEDSDELEPDTDNNDTVSKDPR